VTPVFLSDSVYLHFGTSSVSTGAATNADSTPTVVVAEDGTDLGYVPTVTNVATGLYKVQVDATAGNGFESGRRYSCYAVATVGGITGRDGLGEFEVLAVDMNTGVASVTGAVASVTAGVTLAASAVQAIWDALTSALTTVGSIGKLLVDNINATITSRMATYTQPTGFLAATFPATVASTTNITAGTITTVSGNVTGSVGSVVGLTAANLDTTISSRMASYTQPTGFLAATFPGGTIANTTNITAGTMTTTTNLTTNNDKTGYSIGVGGIGATAFAADAVSAAALSQGAAQEIADEILNRDLVGGASVSSRNVRNSLRALRNKQEISLGTLTVYQEDDSTAAWTATITSAAGNPITIIDPA
jgi:hypothetical protein